MRRVLFRSEVRKFSAFYNPQLDHFNFNNNRTYLQRYLVAMKKWDKGEPIFLYTGNEGDITWFANNTVSGEIS